MSHPKLPPFFLRVRVGCSAISAFLLNVVGLRRFAWAAALIPTFSQKYLCAPGMNCHGCPWAVGACPIGVMAFGSAVHAIPVYAISFTLMLTVMLGRLTCAFLCPFGLLQDILYKIPFLKLKLPRALRYGKYLALLLLVFLLPFWLGFDQSGYLRVDKPEIKKAVNEDGETGEVDGQLDVFVTVTNLGPKPVAKPQFDLAYVGSDKKELWSARKEFPALTVAPGEKQTTTKIRIPNRLQEGDLHVTSPQSEVEQTSPYQLYYCRLCPVGTLEATLPAYASGDSVGAYGFAGSHALRLVILGFFLLLMLMISRPFCRTFCPAGAIYGLFAKLSLARIELDPGACIECGACDKVCPVDLNVSKEVGGAECIACGDCINACPKRGIRRHFGL